MLRLILLLLCCSPLSAAEKEDDWFENDPYEQAQAVSEGELRFLPAPPEQPVHHHHNQLIITPGSLQDGWVELQQCHRHLDPVASLEIVFHQQRIRNLRLQLTENVGYAYVSGHTVQLEDVGKDAVLCLTAETQALQKLPDGRYELHNGPYMRRFLDGYYPMRVSMDIRYPRQIKPVEHLPVQQPGFTPRFERQRILLDTWFEGILHTRFRFMEHL